MIQKIPHGMAQILIWKSIREHGVFTAQEIANKTGYTSQLIRKTLDAWVQNGNLSKTLTKSHTLSDRRLRHLYEIEKDNGVHPPCFKVSAQQEMWVAIKVLKTFSSRDLALATEHEDYAASRYAKCLRKHGYLILHKRGKAGRHTYRYVPKMYTGFYAPFMTKKNNLYDINLAEFMEPILEREAS